MDKGSTWIFFIRVCTCVLRSLELKSFIVLESKLNVGPLKLRFLTLHISAKQITKCPKRPSIIYFLMFFFSAQHSWQHFKDYDHWLKTKDNGWPQQEQSTRWGEQYESKSLNNITDRPFNITYEWETIFTYFEAVTDRSCLCNIGTIKISGMKRTFLTKWYIS